jgi:DNA (cytosine-5)-methyltransferase 1
MKPRYWIHYHWPDGEQKKPKTIGSLLFDLMAANGWLQAANWKKKASGIAPTIVGGSKKHGGPDLGPTRARKSWADLGVDGLGIANEPPERNFVGLPRLTPRMVARV